MPLLSKYPQMRAWAEFCEFSKFEKPKNPQERISTNLSYYAGNYVLIFVVLFVFTCLLNFFLLIGVLMVVGAGFALKTYLKQQLEVAGTKSKSGRKKQQRENKQYATYYIYASIFVIFLFGNAPLAMCMFLTLVIVIGHSLFRKRNLKSNVVRFMDVYNDFGPISSLADYISEWVDDTAS